MTVDTDPGVGEPAGIRSLANERSTKAAELQKVHTTVKSAEETISASSWTGKSRAAFGSAVDSVLPDLTLLAAGLAAQAAILHTYGGQVQQIKEEQAALEHQRRTALAALGGLQVPLTPVAIRDPERDAQHRREQARITEKIDAERSILAGIDSQWNQLVTRRRRIDLATAEALAGRDVLGPIWAFTGPKIHSTDPAALLAMMAGLSASDLQILLGQHQDLAHEIAKASPDAVATWWAGLSGSNGEFSAAQLALIATIPTVIGALDGIPALARVAANRINAENQIKLDEKLIEKYKAYPTTVDRLQKEIDYLMHAVGDHPTVQLYLYDPSKSRIIEMIGTPSASTKHVIVYVPGTFSNLGGFYDGTTQQDATSLWETNPSETVAFVYKDGISPGGADGESSPDYVRLLEANDRDRAMLAGQQLSDFAAGIRLDVNLSGAKTTAIGHSWGLTAVTSSEIAGARYDQVISLSGAGMPPEWKPGSTTTYSDFSYFDILQQAQALPGEPVWDGNTPRSNPAFVHGPYYEGPTDVFTRAPWGPPTGVREQVLLDNHNLIATNSRHNQRLLMDLADEVFE
jgi:uncharacterized protein YukE